MPHMSRTTAEHRIPSHERRDRSRSPHPNCTCPVQAFLIYEVWPVWTTRPLTTILAHWWRSLRLVFINNPSRTGTRFLLQLSSNQPFVWSKKVKSVLVRSAGVEPAITVTCCQVTYPPTGSRELLLFRCLIFGISALHYHRVSAAPRILSLYHTVRQSQPACLAKYSTLLLLYDL